MSQLFTNAPSGFCWATGIEDSFIPQTRPGLRALDEYELTQHYRFWRQDFDLVAESGVSAVRWGIPWYKVQPSPGEWDWSWTDECLDYLVNVKRITPILDLMHYGTPFWLEDSFADPCYPDRVADYAHAVATRYKSLVRYYTPLNEPTINAAMAGRKGLWPPYLRGDQGFIRVIVALAKGIVLTVGALKAEQPDVNTVQVEALWRDWTRDPRLKSFVEFNNARQYLSLDLTMGRVDEQHLLHGWLGQNGVTEGELAWFRENAVRYDALGTNFYPWAYNEKALHENDRVYSVRGRKTHGATIALVLREAYERYGLPMLITETSAKDSVAGRGRWMDQTLAAVRDLRTEGVPVVGYTWFPLFTMIEWDYRTSRLPIDNFLLHLGLYDAEFDEQGTLQRHATPLVARYRKHIAEGMPAIGVPAAVPAAEPTLANRLGLAGTAPLNPALAG